MQNSFDRTGGVKIPKSKGRAKSTVKHGGPEAGLDSQATGKAKKTKVKRGGNVVKYKGVGTTTPIFDNESSFAGRVVAISKIKGSKVKSKGRAFGQRTRDNGDVEVVSGNLKGTGKF